MGFRIRSTLFQCTTRPPLHSTTLHHHYTSALATHSLKSLELLHSHLLPFPLYRCTIQAPRQSIATTPTSKLKFNSLTSHYNTAIPPFFKHSTGNPSSPGALPDFVHSLPPYFLQRFALSFKSPNTGICQLPTTLIFNNLITNK